jgi:hypothetical protein
MQPAHHFAPAHRHLLRAGREDQRTVLHPRHREKTGAGRKLYQNVWVYDLRSNMPNFGKRTPFGAQHLKPFEKLFGKKADGTSKRTEGDWSFTADVDSGATHDGQDAQVSREAGMPGATPRAMEESRWRVFSRQWIQETKADSLDISWIKDEDSVNAASLPEPDVLAAEAMGELTEALRELDGLMQALGRGMRRKRSGGCWLRCWN